MTIGNMMTRDVVTCRGHDTLERATQLMLEHDLGFLPVVDGKGRLIGVVTDRDALLAACRRRAPLCVIVVDTVMTHPPFTCTVHDDPKLVEHRMAEHQIRRLPVVDERDIPIGVVTLSDLARASLRGHDLSSRGPTWALAAITHPRSRTTP